MLLLISDANIVIDMEAGELIEQLFQLPMQFVMPDILYWQEIQPAGASLHEHGLLILEVTGEYIRYAENLRRRYGSAPSVNDLLALALAKQESCPLLTGDQALRSVALQEQIPVMGTIWLLCAMVENKLLNVDAALNAVKRMKARKRRLPWDEVESILNGLRH